MLIATSTVAYQGPGRLDITIGSGDKRFAPTWDMVRGVKNKTMTDAVYTGLYRALMQKSWNENRERWLEVLEMDKVVLVCYCKADAFCHRSLLKRYLIAQAKALGFKHADLGEIFPSSGWS